MIDLELDPRRGANATIIGRKGSGKSVLARRLWDTYPGDALVIDPTGDFRVPDATTVREVPARWPGRDPDEGPVRLRYLPDPGSASYAEDLDAAAGLAYRRGDCLLLLDEAGELTSASRTGPALRRILRQGRHRRLSLVACNPRPLEVDPLLLSQADRIFCFRLPHPRDRDRLAGIIGVPPSELAAGLESLDEHGCLMYDAARHELLVLPALPMRAARAR